MYPNLIDEIRPTDIISITEVPDRHAVCIILTPWMDRIAWVYNLPYPEGKPQGWGLAGGRSDKGDISIEDTCKRESKEEIGADIQILHIIAEGLIHDRQKNNDYWRTVFLCVALNEGNPTIQAFSEDGTPETREFRWFPLENPPNSEELKENVYFKHLATARHRLLYEAIQTALAEHRTMLNHLCGLWESGYRNYQYS